MSVEWLKERNPEPCTLPRDRQDNSGPTVIEKSCFQEIRDLKEAKMDDSNPKCNCVESRHLPGAIACPDCEEIEQSENLKIIEKIEVLLGKVNEKIHSLSYNYLHQNLTIKSQALDEIDLFQKTTLIELRKAFE